MNNLDIEKKYKIYLVSNHPIIDKALFNNINSNDLVIQMNNAIHNNNIDCSSENKLLVIRMHANGYHGYKKNYNGNFKKILFMCLSKEDWSNKNEDIKNMYEQYNDSKELIFISDNVKIYDSNKVPSSGYAIYHYFKNKYPDKEIILIGFYGITKY